MSKPTVSDYFCGAGGSSTGLSAAGFEVKAAANHWALAIETHNTNHPATEHYLDDLQQAHPSLYPRTDVAWFSPSCTSHSLARGRKRKGINQLDLWGETGIDPAEEKSRATMREVVEFSEYHRYDVVLVENVVDVRTWQFYEDWWRAMLNLGYDGRVVYANSQFHGVPQSRDRYYAVFWRKGIPAPNLDYRPAADCPKHGAIQAVQAWKRAERPWGRYGSRNGQYVWRCPQCGAEVKPAHTPASTVIDWSMLGERIGGRSTPLSPKTVERIREGFQRFGRPVMLPYANQEGPARPLSDVLHTIPTMNAIGLAVPPFLAAYYSTGNTLAGLDDAIPTITTTDRHGLIVPPMMVDTTYTQGLKPARSVDQPMPTQTARQSHALIVPDGMTLDELIEQSSFRMLQPHELQLGMSFPSEYIILGNKRDQVRQIGNAVTPNVARWLGERVMEVLA